MTTDSARATPTAGGRQVGGCFDTQSIRFRHLVLLPLFILLSGCASLKQEVGQLEADTMRLRTSIQDKEARIAKLQNQIEGVRRDIAATRTRTDHLLRAKLPEHKASLNKSQTYLASGDGRQIYVNKQCIRPPYGPQPKPFCASREAAREHALAYCSLPLGCDAAMALAENKLDSFSKRFLASEACSRGVATLRQEGYTADQMLVNALESGATSMCKDDGLLSIVGCVAAGAIMIGKLAEFEGCINRAGEQCYRRSAAWERAPARRQEVCTEHVENIIKQNTAMASARAEIHRGQVAIKELEQQIPPAETEIASLQTSLQSAHALAKRNDRRVNEIKGSLGWKMVGGAS